MFMVRVYDKEGNRSWLDNGYIWNNVEVLKNRLREERDNEKKILGASEKTYTIIPINFEESHTVVDMPMIDKEVEINDITFEDGVEGFRVNGDKSIASFLYAWAEKHAEERGYERTSSIKSIEDGNTLELIVKEMPIEP